MSDKSEYDSRSIMMDEDVQDNGLAIEGPPWGLEKVCDYEAGGHHPVHLDDLLHERYRVIHKLGSGGYANVWLYRDAANDAPKYVALKIIIAEGSTADCPESRVAKVMEFGCGTETAAQYLSLPLDQFEINGPNGTHFAFVYPVLGPRVSRLLRIASLDDPGPPLRKICFDATQAMVALHAHGLCHGGMSCSLSVYIPKELCVQSKALANRMDLDQRFSASEHPDPCLGS